MTARIVLLVTSPRLPAGVLTAPAWDLLRSGAEVLAAEDGAQVAALRAAGVGVLLCADPLLAVDRLLEVAAGGGTAVWLSGPAGDADLARRLGLRLTREPGLAELELMYGSWDPPGARLLDAVSVVDRLASPGGDPWKRSQTHASLAQYLREEAYEAMDAIAAGDLDALREELGDVLLQVLLHARLAEQADEAERRFSVDDVAGALVEKLIRRNPHVFAGTPVADLDEIVRNWERIKQEEKARGSALDGIAWDQPALSLAAKVLSRAERAGVPVAVPGPVGESAGAGEPARAGGSVGAGESAGDGRSAGEQAERRLGARLLALATGAHRAGLDAEQALRAAVLDLAEGLRAAEAAEAAGRD